MARRADHTYAGNSVAAMRLFYFAGLAAVCAMIGLYSIQNQRVLEKATNDNRGFVEALEDDNCSTLTSFTSLLDQKLDQLPSSLQDLQARLTAAHVDLSKQIAHLQSMPVATNLEQKDVQETAMMEEELAKRVTEVDHLKSVREWWMNNTREMLRTSDVTEFDVVITTIPRPDGAGLLKGIINNLLGVGVTKRIYLSYGRPETSEMAYLQALVKEYSDKVGLKVLSLSSKVWAKVDKRSIAAKTAANEWQALSINTQGKPLVRIEDDVQLASFFNVRLSRVIADLQRIIPGRAYVLDLCVPYDLRSLPEVVPGVVLYPEGKFWGTQGLLFSPEALNAGAGQYYYDKGVETEPIGLQDMMLKDFILENNGYDLSAGKVLLLALTHSLVQHVGLKSTREGSDSSWQVQSFIDNLNF